MSRTQEDQTAYEYVCEVLVDEARITRDDTARLLSTGKHPDVEPLDRLRTRLSKEKLIEAMADATADEADIAWIRTLLKRVYNYESGAS